MEKFDGFYLIEKQDNWIITSVDMEYTFSKCVCLPESYMGKKITEIDSEIKLPSHVKELILGDNMETVADNAFENSPSIEYIYIGKALLRYYFLRYMMGLKEIEVDSQNKCLVVYDGNLYDWNVKFLIIGFNAHIREGTKGIAARAFNHKVFNSIVIPSSVKEFGHKSFYDCQIGSITFSEDLSMLSNKVISDCQIDTLEFPGENNKKLAICFMSISGCEINTLKIERKEAKLNSRGISNSVIKHLNLNGTKIDNDNVSIDYSKLESITTSNQRNINVRELVKDENYYEIVKNSTSFISMLRLNGKWTEMKYW